MDSYLAMERTSLLARYVSVERELGEKRIEYANVLCDEKRTKAQRWMEAVENGMSASAADKYSDHHSVHSVTESIFMRAVLDNLEREAALLLFLLREA